MSKLTKEQMHGMSDIQILRKLYELLGFEVHEYVFEEVITIRSGDKVTTAELSPNDIMPLAFEHLVNIQWFMDSKEVRAYTHSGKSVTVGYQHTYRQKAALRAHVCCLILVLQEGK